LTNKPYVRSALVQTALELTPPLIRESLLEESGFRKEYGIRTEAILSLGDSGVSVQVSYLFEAVRKILSGSSVEEVTDTDDHKWKLKNISKEGDLPTLELSYSRRHLILPDFAALSPDSITRLRSLDKAVSDVNLPGSVRNIWCDVLTKRALEDDEVETFQFEFRDTPIYMERSIHIEMVEGKSSISSLVPTSRRYYERLVGEYDGSISIQDYSVSSGRKLFQELSAWQIYDGFLLSLFLSSHSALTTEIYVEQLSCDDLIRAFSFLEKHGDRTSQLGAIETGLRILSSRPEIEPRLITLIEQIRSDDVTSKTSGFKLLSALFILVDGELSRTRLLSKEPPFYRRLAALSQAALIHRQVVKSTVDIDQFCEWAFSNRGEPYYMQSFADMRAEPRWNPDLAAAAQMKADFIGRIMIASKNCKKNIKEGELYDLVLGTKSGSLHSDSDFFHPYLPGPLEGAEESQNILPAEIAETIETQLGAEEVGPTSFIALVNSALIFRIGADQAELAAKALKIGSYRLANVEDRSQLMVVLNGLANVAAIARSRTLADELRILVRRYRRDTQYALSIEEAIRINLVAAASLADMNDWREFVGDMLTELAFSDLDGDDGKILYSHLLCLCHSVPELWISCGRAEAALKAYNASRNPA